MKAFEDQVVTTKTAAKPESPISPPQKESLKRVSSTWFPACQKTVVARLIWSSITPTVSNTIEPNPIPPVITNRIVQILAFAVGVPFIPIQWITTFVLGICVSLTGGLLLLPLSMIWMIFYFPMLGVSWAFTKAPDLRELVGLILIPWVLAADLFVQLMPSMGEIENRTAKMMLCQSWPYTWQFSQLLHGERHLDSIEPDTIALNEVVNRMAEGSQLMQRVLSRIAAGQPLDPQV